VTDYDLYESTAPGSEGTRVLTGTATTTYAATGLSDGTTYYFEATALNVAGESPASAQVAATPSSIPPSSTSTTSSSTPVSTTSATSSPTLPGAPAALPSPAPAAVTPTPLPVRTTVPAPASSPGRPGRLAAQAGNNDVALSWVAPPPGSGPRPTGYDVYLSTKQGSRGSLVAVVPATRYTVTGLSDETTYFFEVTATTTTAQGAPSNQVSATPAYPVPPPGYRVAGSGGQVSAFGKLTSYPLGQPASAVVAVASTPDGRGFWLALKNGGVIAAGDAHLYGPAQGTTLASPVTGLAVTPDGRGYWLATIGGRVLAFGDARTFGPTSDGRPTGQVVGIASTADGHGYWLVTASGDAFSFGDAHTYGSIGDRHLNQRVVGIARTPDGRGYWMVASDGGVFGFGDAHFYGSVAVKRLNQPVIGIAPTADGHGYWLVASDGGVFCFGDAPFLGSVSRLASHQKVVGITG
jgi:Fibronectin type III domain